MRARAQIVLLAVSLALVEHAAASAQSWRTVTASRRLDGESELAVDVRYGAGRFTVRPAPAGVLYRSRLRYDEDSFRAHSDFDGHRLKVGLDGTRTGRIASAAAGEMELELAGTVPTDLELELGAVRADIDLGGLALTGLSVRTGASQSLIDVSIPNARAMERAELQVGAADFTARRLGNLNARRIEVNAGVGDMTIDLTGEWRQDADVSVKMGLGSLQLRLPTGVGVKLERNTLLTSLDADGMEKRGEAYYSAGWDEATRRITVQLDAAFGSVEVVQAP